MRLHSKMVDDSGSEVLPPDEPKGPWSLNMQLPSEAPRLLCSLLRLSQLQLSKHPHRGAEWMRMIFAFML
jgi:hypothetical protein